MKIISDAAVSAYLLRDLNRKSIMQIYIPLLVSGLEMFEQYPDAVPERTVRQSTTTNSDTTHLFMPCILPETVGVKVVSGGPSNSRKKLGFQGSVSVLNEYTGELDAVINAKTLTAFRTALASCVSLVKVFCPDLENKNLNLVLVFGAGPQAFWHVILVTRLYPALSNVNIISRSKDSAQALVRDLERFVTLKLTAFSSEQDLNDLKQVVRKSSIIFGCTPSTDAIIKEEYINKDAQKTKFISLIGSYKPHMIELDLDFINKYYSGQETKVIVDSKSHCLAESGELIQGKISESQLVSITEFHHDSEKDRQSTLREVKSDSGVILQKLVGLSVMDIVVAKHLAQAVEGKVIEDF
ncbi:hypothetical protein HF325_002829 [Metschnikowia pulcherrima]|uniref:Ornithine cyclodeaminase n=1 Tax=Metschnikowia pulcherrima TaxID=27326 RepID=A0A8H7GSR2_9ASCO|nr:hypothetical protein HF325_002829 [Metschnikowia pulcherrima]